MAKLTSADVLRVGASVGVLVALALAWACGDRSPTQAPAAPSLSVTQASQQVVLENMARTLATSLTDPGMVAQLRQEILSSPYVEWRVHLNRILDDRPLWRPALFGGSDADSAWAEIRPGIPQMELYFPVAQQRVAWLANAGPLEVAVPIGHSDRFLVFTASGQRRDVDEAYEPTVATLVLGPSEINYADVLSAVRGGSRTGAMMRIRRAARMGGGTRYARAGFPLLSWLLPFRNIVNTDQRTQLIYFYLINDHEPPLRGSAELEAFGDVNGSYTGCAYFTDLDEHTDYNPAEYSAASSIASAAPEGSDVAHLDAWEDDDEACVLHTSSDDHYGSTPLSVNDAYVTLGTSLPGQQFGDINIEVSYVVLLQ